MKNSQFLIVLATNGRGGGGKEDSGKGRPSMALDPKLHFIKIAPVLLISHVEVDLENNLKTMFEN